MTDEGKLTLEILQKDDLSEIIQTFAFPWTSPEETQSKWQRYYAEQQTKLRTVCVAKIDEEFVGYGSLVRNSHYSEFKNNRIPEINDVWISIEQRGKGFGKKIILYLEAMARREHYQQIGIGVGLYHDYGRAQKLYAQLGYIPDGKGVTYKYLPVVPGASYPLDDDLVLWLKKDLP